MHALCCVLVKDDPGRDPADIEALLEPQMQPFYEGLEMPPHEAPCYCVGSAARREISAAIRNSVILFSTAKGGLAGPAYRRLEVALFRQHPKAMEPLPNCPDCNGSGVEIVTYNENATWDWWQVGGRFEGAWPDIVMRAGDLEDNPCYSLLTPEGVWTDDPDEIEQLLKEYSDHFAVMVDYHY